jgi:hypothetical protein
VPQCRGQELLPSVTTELHARAIMCCRVLQSRAGVVPQSLTMSYSSVQRGTICPSLSVHWQKAGASMVHSAQPTTFQERVEILERSVAGQSDPDIAAALYCSVWTVRKWRRIGQRQGRAGLAPPIGRPPGGPLGSVLPELREAILQLRRSHPGWGADTILAELRTDPLWAEHPLPSRARQTYAPLQSPYRVARTSARN